MAEALLALLVLGGAAALASTSRASVPVHVTSATGALQAGSPPTGDPSVAEGRKVFLRTCAWCHGDQGQGTQFGPSLQNVGTAAADFELRTGRMPLKNSSQKPTHGPPAFPSSTISSIVAYVGTLGKGQPIPPLAPGDISSGESLFVMNCAPCHSSSGTGMVLPDGSVAPQLYNTAPQQVAEAVRIGPGQMPRFGPKQLDPSQLNDVVGYVHQLGSQQVKGGEALDQLGPIAEGLLVFLLPLPLLVVVIRLLGKKAPR